MINVHLNRLDCPQLALFEIWLCKVTTNCRPHFTHEAPKRWRDRSTTPGELPSSLPPSRSWERQQMVFCSPWAWRQEGHEVRRKNAKNTGTSWLRFTTGRSWSLLPSTVLSGTEWHYPRLITQECSCFSVYFVGKQSGRHPLTCKSSALPSESKSIRFQWL